ncbi:unnamed protein product [Caenorhabditis bovis]|uniref:Thyroglobulin type-1 domain-containing protein n=1 Tax=Caenorhabditis bovis TaxID=2654633 RepID=A0A8S1E771_9PELO|nr:unnamed protein product [Caenorhabditis bovis]
MLDDLRGVEILGRAIPQCEDNGMAYRRRQCLAGTDVCWCVTSLGRRLSSKEYRNDKECETVRRKQENQALKAAAILRDVSRSEKGCTISYAGICPKHPTNQKLTIFPCSCDTECPIGRKCCPTGTTHACLPVLTFTQPPKSNQLSPTMSLVCGANEQFSACYSPCQPSCQDPTTPACPAPDCQAGCICLPGYIRRDGSPRSACVPRALCQAYDLTIRCADDRRQYQTCGSACPVSCENRNQPRCSERCVTGCFCKIPYILENGEDPLHSRCILPSDCPPSPTPPSEIGQQFLLRNPHLATNFPQYATTPRPPFLTTTQKTIIEEKTALTPTLIPNNEHCPDPLKNFLSCGSKCPASCDRPLSQSASLDCALSCVQGCFCRLPYVLLNSSDPNSSCILPQLCPKKSIPPSTALPSSEKSCQDPRKEWSECGAQQCARSCSNPIGRCSSGECSAGCVCREPYVILHPNDPTSRCVLPSECEKSCEDPAKEFVSCGSSCPMGCDNRHPKHCAPCQTGCFCRNGLVFENSSTWHTSKCVRLEDCPSEPESEIISTSTSTSTTTTTTLSANSENEQKFEAAISKFRPDSSDNDLLQSQCPATTFDVGGRGCNSDIDCPVEQRCCRPLIVSLGVNPQRCVCPDKNAVWSSCGTLCPEYCGQPAVPVCSSTCSPGCHCAPGFIKSRNDVAAPCVPRETCSTIVASRLASISASEDEPNFMRMATIREITSQQPYNSDVIAVAILLSRDGTPIGRFTFTQLTLTTLKVHGEAFGLPPGKHAVVIHQFGDASEGCSRVGAPFTRSLDRTPSLGDISESGKFDHVVDWPVADVVGRALVIYPFSTAEWGIKTHLSQGYVACGTIGIAKRKH